MVAVNSLLVLAGCYEVIDYKNGGCCLEYIMSSCYEIEYKWFPTVNKMRKYTTGKNDGDDHTTSSRKGYPTSCSLDQ